MTASDPCPLSAFLADRTKIRRHGYFAINVPSVGNPHPEPIELIGGLPNHGFFPVTAARIELRDRPFEAHQKTVVETAVVSNDPDKVDIKTAFQYSNLQGIDPLLGQIKEFARRVIKPYGQDWEILATAGALNGIARCFDIFVNPGDVVLFEEFTFTPMLRPLADKGGIAVPITLKGVRGSHNIDYYEELKHLLENWETEKPGLPKPKILYTIPTGHNPLGLSQTVGTKKKIYKLAQEHNFLILEDEPYGYLTFDKVDDESTKYDLSNDEFIDALTPSYISFDTDGRVVRNETFSKIFSPGLRLGFVVINKSFVKQFLLSGEVTIKAPSGYSQLFVNNTIHQLGGIEGWIHWIIQVRNEYLRRKNAFVKSVQATEAAKRGYLDVIDPDCGMFVSIYINVEKHREFNGSNHKQILEQFYIKAAEAGYLAVLGHNMSVDEGYSAPRATFIRNAISYVDSPQVFEEAASRLNTATLALFQ